MLRIQRNGTTTFVVTATENVTISNPEFLFEFIEEQSSDSVFCILTNTSTQTERFDEFTIIDGTDVTFSIDGFYTYKIYEQANGSGNLDPDGLTMVETGRAHVYVTDASDNEYTNDSESTYIYE